MLFNMNNLDSFNSARREGLKNTNFLVWTGIHQAIPPELLVKNSRVLIVHIFMGLNYLF